MNLQSPVLILGAGINGAALARELVLNGVGVVVVDTRDLAAGTTAYSSRLIHGGLRYLEHGDFELVRESLAERTRWLQLAPHLVRPLRLYIPVEKRLGGFAVAAKSFLGLRRGPEGRNPGKKRGLWTVRAGLWLYDRYARDRSLARGHVHRLPDDAIPPVDPRAYRWACAYYDAQLRYPERFTLELLLDARNLAAELGIEFELFTYHRALRRGDQVDVASMDGRSTECSFRPAAIVNATGAWVDYTLAELGVPSKPLIGGTKGSHFITYHGQLVQLLGGDGVYVEARDGRPVFILPFGNAALVGTTDEPFSGDPDEARATPAELQYLMEAVHEVFPQITLEESDIELAYSGVRPLPASGPKTPAAITRKHWLEEHTGTSVPCYSIVGGKLTTCRSLAESAAKTILERLGRKATASSDDRPLPGGVGMRRRGSDGKEHAGKQNSPVPRELSEDRETAVLELYGGRAEAVLASLQSGNAPPNVSRDELLDGTLYPVALARYMVEHEWVRRLDDLVERRLMLLYHRPLTRRCLHQLADVLVHANLLDVTARDHEIDATVERLRERFRKLVVG